MMEEIDQQQGVKTKYVTVKPTEKGLVNLNSFKQDPISLRISTQGPIQEQSRNNRKSQIPVEYSRLSNDLAATINFKIIKPAEKHFTSGFSSSRFKFSPQRLTSSEKKGMAKTFNILKTYEYSKVPCKPCIIEREKEMNETYTFSPKLFQPIE